MLRALKIILIIDNLLFKWVRIFLFKHFFTFLYLGQVTKEGNKTTDVSCSPSQVMKVVMAEYGGFSDGKIFVHQNDADCTLPSACVVKSQCDNKISCDITVNNILFKNDECPGKAKLLYMEYLCVNSLIKPPITKGKFLIFLCFDKRFKCTLKKEFMLLFHIYMHMFSLIPFSKNSAVLELKNTMDIFYAIKALKSVSDV